MIGAMRCIRPESIISSMPAAIWPSLCRLWQRRALTVLNPFHRRLQEILMCGMPRAQLPDRISLIGGIEAVNFLELGLEDLDAYVKVLMERMSGTPYVVANSDSCPPYVALEKFHRIGALVKNNK